MTPCYLFIVQLWSRLHSIVLTMMSCGYHIAENTRFERGFPYLTVRLTSCLTDLDLTKQVNLFQTQHMQRCWTWIQTNKTGGQLYIETSSRKVYEFSWTRAEFYIVIVQASYDDNAQLILIADLVQLRSWHCQTSSRHRKSDLRNDRAKLYRIHGTR